MNKFKCKDLTMIVHLNYEEEKIKIIHSNPTTTHLLSLKVDCQEEVMNSYPYNHALKKMQEENTDLEYLHK